MNLNYEKIKNHIPGLVDFDILKKFAVAISLVKTEKGVQILFEERAHAMKHQPGDICLPGGRVEKGETPKEAVMRELCEELLISPEQITFIGACDVYLTGKGAVIYPFVVEIQGYEDTFSKDEVEEVFFVPVEYFQENEPEEVFTTTKEIPGDDFPFDRIYGGKKYPWREYRKRIVFYQYERWTIWGMTGKILESFAKLFLYP